MQRLRAPLRRPTPRAMGSLRFAIAAITALRMCGTVVPCLLVAFVSVSAAGRSWLLQARYKFDVPSPEISITPEMIEAGSAARYRHRVGAGPAEKWAVESIFR